MKDSLGFIFITLAAISPLAAQEPQVISGPERWLNFGMLPPSPLAVRSDGRRAVVASNCQTMLYELPSARLLHTWDQRFESAGFSGDGRFLVSVRRGEIAVWDAETCRAVRRFSGRQAAWNRGYANGGYRLTAALNAYGSQLAIDNIAHVLDGELPENGVLLCDVATGAVRQRLSPPTKTCGLGISFSPNGRQILAAYSDQTCALWDTQTGRLLGKFLQVVAALSPDGQWLATLCVSRDGKVLGDPTQVDFWDATRGKPAGAFKHYSALTSFAFSPDSKRLLAAFGGHLIEWDVQSKRKLYEGGDDAQPYTSVAYSPDGQRRFAVSETPNGMDNDVDHSLHGWTAETGAKLPIRDWSFDTYNGTENLFFFPQGDRFIDLAADGFAVRDVLTGKTLQTLPEYRDGVCNGAFMPDGRKFFFGKAGRCLFTDIVSGKQREWQFPVSVNRKGCSVVDEGRLLFGYDNTGIALFDLRSATEVWGLPLVARNAAISPDGKHIAASFDQYNLAPGQGGMALIETSDPDHMQVLDWYVWAVAFRPDGRRFLAATPAGVYECDTRSGQRLRSLPGIPGRALAVAYSPDGKRAVACGVADHGDPREPVDADNTGWAVLWDCTTCRAIRLVGHTGPVITAAFNPDGTRCATGSLDRTVRLWETADGRQLAVFRGHTGGLYRIAYSPLGDRLLTAAEDGAALWNVGRFSARPIESLPLAASFATVETIGGDNATPGVSKKPSGAFLPVPPGYRPAAVPVWHDWAIVEIGHCGLDRLPQDYQAAISSAKSKTHVNPPARRPLYGPGYEFCGASRDGSRRAYLSPGSEVLLYGNRGKILRTWRTMSFFDKAVLAPSGREMVIGHTEHGRDSGFHNDITVYDAATGAPKHVIYEDDGRYLSAMYIDPQEKTILLNFNRESLVLCDYGTGRKIGQLAIAVHCNLLDAAYSPDGRFLAIGGWRGLAVQVYNVATLRPHRTLANFLPVSDFAFSADGKRLLARQSVGSGAELLTMWEVDSARRLWTRYGGVCGQPIFSPDGTRLLMRSDECAMLRDASQGEELCLVLGPLGDDPGCLAFGSDGSSLHLDTPDGPLLWPARGK